MNIRRIGDGVYDHHKEAMPQLMVAGPGVTHILCWCNDASPIFGVKLFKNPGDGRDVQMMLECAACQKQYSLMVIQGMLARISATRSGVGPPAPDNR